MSASVATVDPRAAARGVQRSVRDFGRRVRIEADWLSSRRGRADLALFHEFAPAPTGGGHQFLRALLGEFQRRELHVEVNRLSARTPACLFNSFNYDVVRLRRFVRRGCRMVHRVDGPIGAYRGFDDGTDRMIAVLNSELADVTVLQSRYSFEKHRELDLQLREPVVIPNTVDPAVFYPPLAREPLGARRVRVIATSWSDNARKGADTLAWLDRQLDWERYDLTFVGRTPQRFERIRVIAPVAPGDVARLLRQHDVYLAPSRDDPCSNALLEALACGLPAAYLDSGGHPELVGEGGLAYRTDDEIPDVLDRLRRELEERRAAISVTRIATVADRYLEVLGLGGKRPT